MEDRPLVAWCDESMRTYHGASSYYICAVVENSLDDAVMSEFVRLRPKGSKKLHWRDMGTLAQRRSLCAIVDMGISAITVVGRPVNMRKLERARRKCLELLIPLLESAGVEKIVLESRKDSLDKRDREMAVSLARKGWTKGVELSHVRGEEEPRLWIPDQIVGAQGHVDARGEAAKEWRMAWNQIVRNVERREIVL